MPMVSKKDLDEAELETVRVSKNPTVVMTANCEVLAIEEATVFVGELDLFVTVMLLENTPSVLSLGKLEWPETTSHQERQENSLRHIKSCTIRRTWFVHEFLFFINFSSSSSQETVNDMEIPATRRSESASEDTSARGNLWHEPTEIETSQTMTRELQDDELQGVPYWLEQFKDGLVDESVPEHRESSSSSHEPLLEPRAKVAPSKHNIFSFEDDNNEGFLQKEDALVQCCPGDLITADHKKSLVKDVSIDMIIDTLWWYETWLLSGYTLTHVQPKTSQETQKCLQKVLGADQET